MNCDICEEIEEDCICTKCSECGSRNLEFFDDGPDYPPNIECLDCGHWD